MTASFLMTRIIQWGNCSPLEVTVSIMLRKHLPEKPASIIPPTTWVYKIGALVRWPWVYHTQYNVPPAHGWFGMTVTTENWGYPRWITVEKKAPRDSPVWKWPFLILMFHIWQHQILWNGMNSEKACAFHLSILPAASSLASGRARSIALSHFIILNAIHIKE